MNPEKKITFKIRTIDMGKRGLTAFQLEFTFQIKQKFRRGGGGQGA